MKRLIVLLAMLITFSNVYSQTDGVNQLLDNHLGKQSDLDDTKNQKIIEDFIAASEKDTMFGNGRWATIGKQNTDTEILKEGLKGYDRQDDNINILKSIDHENYYYILFSHQKQGEKTYLSIGMYHKTIFMFRTYDAFTYQNHYNPEVLGQWKMSEAFSKKGNNELTLIPITNQTKFGDFLEIKEDFTFHYYCTVCSNACVDRVGRYDVTPNTITFYFNGHAGEDCSSKQLNPFTLGPFNYKKENGVLTLDATIISKQKAIARRSQ